MRHYGIIILCSLVLATSGCYLSQDEGFKIEEKNAEDVTIEETFRVNNCFGEVQIDKDVSRSYTSVIVGANDSVSRQRIENLLNEKYLSSQGTKVEYKFVVPQGKDVEFHLAWDEKIFTGQVTSGKNQLEYSVRIPISVEQVSSSYFACSNSTPTYTSTFLSTNTLEVPSPSGTPIISNKLRICTSLIKQNCIYGLRKTRNDTLSIYMNLNLEQSKHLYLRLDRNNYTIDPLADLKGKFVCSGIPLIVMNQKILIQVFITGEEHPFAQGLIFFERSLLPTETPAPPVTTPCPYC